MEVQEKLLTVSELAEFLSVDKSWVYSRNREKGPDALPKISVGKYKRYKFSEVMAWLEKQNEVE